MVAVTGATGHLGTVLVRQLLEMGEEVRYTTRSGTPPGLSDSRATAVEANLFDVQSMTRAFEGASVVIHSAARISIMPGDQANLYRVNVEGTRNALQAARQGGARRFVDVGSIEAFPLEEGPIPITESGGFDPERTVMEYGRSKALSMQAVLDASGDGIECVVCCPTAFIGPPDYRRSPMGQVILDVLRAKLPAYVDGGFDFVDVRDIANGIIRAGEAGEPGSVYLLSGRYASIPKLMEIIESISGKKRPAICVSSRFMRPIMPVIEMYYRATGRAPRFTRSSLQLLSLGVRVDSTKAKNELGYTARPLEDTVADTIEWFVENGYT